MSEIAVLSNHRAFSMLDRHIHRLPELLRNYYHVSAGRCGERRYRRCISIPADGLDAHDEQVPSHVTAMTHISR